MRVIFGSTRKAIVGAALVALTLGGATWVAAGPGGPAGVVERDAPPLAATVEYPPKDPCLGPVNGWQGDSNGNCPPS